MSGAMASPYAALRAARRSPDPTAETGDPPAAHTPTTANCDAPVKTSSGQAHTLTWADPAADASTPNDTPKTPIAAASRIESRRYGSSAGAMAAEGTATTLP